MKELAVLYVRVSSEEQQDNTSMDSQEKTGRHYADLNGLEIVKLWRGPESAWKNDSKDDGDRVRKNFVEMLDYVAKNKIKHLVFDVPDRMTRNEDDKIRVRKLIRHDGVTVHFARTNKKLHKYSDSDEFFMFGIEVLMAEKYSADLSKRIRKGMDSTVEKGQFPAIAPLGYLNNSVTKVLDIDPVRGPLVKMAFELKAKYKTIDEIVEILYQKGLRSRKLGTKFPGNMRVVRSRMAKLLRDPFYYGEFNWNGGFYKGAHKPLVSRDLWQKAQDSYGVFPRKQKERCVKFPFNGILKCGLCGCSVIGTFYKKGKYERYHCTLGRGKHKNCYISPEEMSKLFHTQIAPLHLPAEAIKSIKQHLTNAASNDNEISAQTISRLENEKKILTGRVSTLYDDRADRRIDEAFWKEKNAEYMGLIRNVEAQLVDARKGFSGRSLDKALFTIELVNLFIYRYKTLTFAQQGDFLKILLLNSLITNKTLSFSVKNHFSFLYKMKNNNWWRRWDLNPRPDLFR